MAIRDKSQKAAFLYTNIYQLYKKAQEGAAPLSSENRVWRAEDLTGIKVEKYEAPRLVPNPGDQPVAAVAQKSQEFKAHNPFDDLKANLIRLNDLHARLRVMLKELEDVVNKK